MVNFVSWYRSLPRRKRLVVQAASFISVSQILLNVMYFMFTFTLTLIEWNLLIFSSITSVAAVYYALYGIWRFDASIDKAREEAFSRLGTQTAKKLGDLAVRIDERLSELTPEQRERLTSLAERGIDLAFGRLERLAKRRPKLKRVRKI